jgi:hypothetical protein
MAARSRAVTPTEIGDAAVMVRNWDVAADLPWFDATTRSVATLTTKR